MIIHRRESDHKTYFPWIKDQTKLPKSIRKTQAPKSTKRKKKEKETTNCKKRNSCKQLTRLPLPNQHCKKKCQGHTLEKNPSIPHPTHNNIGKIRINPWERREKAIPVDWVMRKKKKESEVVREWKERRRGETTSRKWSALRGRKTPNRKED